MLLFKVIENELQNWQLLKFYMAPNKGLTIKMNISCSYCRGFPVPLANGGNVMS